MQPGKDSVTESIHKAMSRRPRNDRSDGASLKADGKLFQARAAATRNARSPSVERLVGLTTRVGESELRPLVTAVAISRREG